MPGMEAFRFLYKKIQGPAQRPAQEFTQPHFYTPPAKKSWRAEVRLQGKLQANRGCVTLQRRGCRSNSGLEILRRTRSFPERTNSAGSVAAILWQLEILVYRERPQRHCRGGPGHPDAEEGPGHARGPQGGQWSNHFQQTASAYNARPHKTVHGARKTWKQPATEFRVLQDNADRFQRNKDLTNRRIKAVEDEGAFRAPTNAARSFNPQYGAAAAGRGLHDRPEHRGPGDPAEAGAAGAPGQRQRGGPAGQASSCEAAGRLPGASKAQNGNFA